MATQNQSRNRRHQRQTRHHPRHREHHQMMRTEPTQGRRFAGLGALAVGAGGVALASMVGVGELVIGGVAAYVAYRVIRYGIAPSQAIIEGVELERGTAPETMSKAA